MSRRCEEDLTCPTCMGIFKDPVLLSCGHSFCKSCLHRWWTVKRTRECPVCRTQSQSRNPPPNLALKNLCESFVLERDQKASEAEEGLQELKDKLKTLKDRLKVLKEARQEYDRVTEHIKNQVRSTEKQIKTQFKKLHRFLEEEEESRIRALRDEEERKTQGVKDKMEALSREVAALSETVRAVEDELGDGDASLLLQSKAAVDRMQRRPLLDPLQLRSAALIDQASHLGNLAFNVWVKMKDAVSYSPVVLDPNSAGSLLSMSEDLTRITEADLQLVPDTADRLTFFSVLGSEGLDSGSHSWDVQVGDSRCWGLGLMTKSGPGQDLRESESWRLVNGLFGLTAFSPSYEATKLPEMQNLQRVRVHLDWDAGRLTFTDPDTDTQIHAIAHTFTDKLFPYFYNWDERSVRILPGSVSVHVRGHV